MSEVIDLDKPDISLVDMLEADPIKVRTKFNTIRETAARIHQARQVRVGEEYKIPTVTLSDNEILECNFRFTEDDATELTVSHTYFKNGINSTNEMLFTVFQITWDNASQMPIAEDCAFMLMIDQTLPHKENKAAHTEEDNLMWESMRSLSEDMSLFRLQEMQDVLELAEHKVKL